MKVLVKKSEKKIMSAHFDSLFSTNETKSSHRILIFLDARNVSVSDKQ